MKSATKTYSKEAKLRKDCGNEWIRMDATNGKSGQPVALVLVHQAIATGIFGSIQWDDRADTRARSNPDLQGLTPEGIRRLLHDFVCNGGRVDERCESRPEWLQANADRSAYYRDFWYRAIVPVPDLFTNGLFIEIRLFDDDPQDPWVEIVNAHPQV